MIENNFNNFNSKLQQKASSLRSSMTKAEVCLWKYALRSKLMKGYTFNRKRPVMSYITDFMSKELLLIIEVDGMYHYREEVFNKDKVCQENLESAGYKVIRFQNEQVLKDIKNVIRAIEIVVEERERELGLEPT